MGLSYLLIKKILYIGESVPRQNGSTLQGAFILSRSLAHSLTRCREIPQLCHVCTGTATSGSLRGFVYDRRH